MYPYLAEVRWAATDRLLLKVQSRDQRSLAVLTADPLTGETDPVVQGHAEEAFRTAGALALVAALAVAVLAVLGAYVVNNVLYNARVKALAIAVLRHRMLLSPAAEIEGRAAESIVADLIQRTEAPR